MRCSPQPWAILWLSTDLRQTEMCSKPGSVTGYTQSCSSVFTWISLFPLQFVYPVSFCRSCRCQAITILDISNINAVSSNPGLGVSLNFSVVSWMVCSFINCSSGWVVKQEVLVRFEFSSAVRMTFWVVTPCRLVGRYQRFGETCCLYLQGWR
jgi:hypothetical protein